MAIGIHSNELPASFLVHVEEVSRERWGEIFRETPMQQHESLLVVARSLSEARHAQIEMRPDGARTKIVSFGGSLTGHRFERIVVIEPLDGFRPHEVEYLTHQVTLKRRVSDKLIVVKP